MPNDLTIKGISLTENGYVAMTEQQLLRLLKEVASAQTPASTIDMTSYMPPARALPVSPTTHAQRPRRYADATPLGMLSFLLAASPMSAILLSWGLTGPDSLLALDGVYFFYGGLGLWVASLLEWLQGNTFALVNFAGFGSFWLALGYIYHIPSGILLDSHAYTTPPFTEAIALFLVFFGLYCAIMSICALRVNVVFVFLLSAATFSLWLLAASYFVLGRGHPQGAEKLLKGCGAASFLGCLFGWWAFFATMMEAMGFPFRLPMGHFTLPIAHHHHV